MSFTLGNYLGILILQVYVNTNLSDLQEGRWTTQEAPDPRQLSPFLFQQIAWMDQIEIVEAGIL